MEAINGGPRRRNKKRQSVSWVLAIAVLALASPATAMGAAGQKRASVTTPGASQARTGADGPSTPNARLGHNLLALGSGYGIRAGSPLVRDLQRRLARMGYPAGRVDGLFGPRTWRAVVAFQASHGLQMDGIVGPRTSAALSAPIPILGPGAGDQPGGSSAVRSLQRRLAHAGDTPGPIDGHYGALTEQAVRRFQGGHRLPASGVAGARTLALLGASLSHKPVLPRQPAPTRTHGSNPGSHAPGSNETPAPVRLPATATPTTKPEGTSHPSGSGPVPWVTIVGGLAVVFALILSAPLTAGAFRRTRRRRDAETAVASPTKIPANPMVVQETDVATARDYDHAASRQNGNPVPANGNHVSAFANGHHAPVPANGHHASVFANGNHAPVPANGHQAQVAETSADAPGAFDVGLWLEAQGSMAEAQAAYHRADERGHPAAASKLGRLLEEHGALAEAEAAYRRADDRGDGDGAFNLAVLLEERGAVDEAEAAYRRAVDRGHDGAATNLGVLLEEHGALDEAEAAYRRAVEHGAAAASFNLGVLLEERGDLAGAEEAYCCAEDRGDDNVANMARAALLDLRGEPQAAGAGRVRGADHV